MRILSALMNCSIHSAILAIHITEHNRSNQGMIQRGIENALVLRGSFDADFRQFGFPSLGSCLTHLFETLSCHLGFVILTGSFTAHRRDTYLNIQFLHRLVKESRQCHPLAFAFINRLHIHTVNLGEYFRKRFREYGMEIDFTLGSPTLHHSHAFDGTIVHYTEFCIQRAVTIIIIKVEHDMLFLHLLESIAMVSATEGSGQLCLNLRIFQENRVISGSRLFGGMIDS